MSEIKERPILFSAPMVRAILEGRKTVTRRALNQRVLKNIGYGVQLGECHELPSEGPLHTNSIGYYTDFCPYGQPGDRLWVRETFKTSTDCRPQIDEPYIYAADLNSDGFQKWAARWKPSIHMPRAASRILLEITDVRVERLQDGDGETAFESRYVAEGIHRIHHGDGEHYYHPFKSEPGPGNCIDPIDAWRELWVSINGAESWNANPWVWVVEFKQVSP